MAFVSLLLGALHAMVPITLTSTGEIFSQRSGVVNIGLEGILLISAFAAVLGAEMGGPMAGLMVGMGTGAFLGLVHGVISVYLRGDQIISGVGLNVLGLGLVAFGLIWVWGVAGYHQVDSAVRIARIATPLGNMSPMVLVTIVMAIFTYYLLEYTNLGQQVKAVGENPEAADAAGIRVERIRLLTAVYAGALGGLAGAYLSIDWLATITRELPAGRGFIALANVVFSQLNPLLAIAGGLLFGFFDGLGLWIATRREIVQFIPYQFVLMLPYVVTLLVVAGAIGRTRFPKAIAQPYRRE